MRLLLAALLAAAPLAHAGAPPLAGGLSFDVDTIDPGTVAELTFSIFTDGPYSDVDVELALPTDVSFAGPATTTCDGELTLAQDRLTLSGARIGIDCEIKVHVRGDAVGSHDLTTSQFTTSSETFPGTSTTLTVVDDVPWNASFVPSSIPVGDTSTLLVSFDAKSQILQSARFTVDLPPGLDNAGWLSTDCTGATVSETAQGFSFFAGSLNTASACTVSADVRATSAGDYTVVSSVLQDFGGTRTGAVAAELNAFAAPLRAVFVDDPVAPGGTAHLELTLTNFDRSLSASDVAFSLDLDSLLTGLTLGTLPADPCGTGSTVSATNGLTFGGGSLTSGESCRFEVPVLIPANATGGDYTATTSAVDLNLGGSATQWSAAPVRLQVSPVPTVGLEINPTAAGPSETVDFTWTVTNTDPAQALTGGTFRQELEGLGGLAQVTLPADRSCGTSSASQYLPATTEPARIVFTGLELAAGASCTLTANLLLPGDIGSGEVSFVPDQVQATVGGASVLGLPTGASLTLNALPQLSMALSPAVAGAGETVTATFVIRLGEHVDPFTDLAFTLDLDAALPGLTATSLPADGSCGSSSEMSGTSALTFSFGSLGTAGGGSEESCSFDVELTVPSTPAAGAHTLTTSGLDVAQGGTQWTTEAASADLTIAEVSLDLAFAPSTVQPGDTFTATWTLINERAEEAFVVDMNESLLSALPGATAANLTNPPCSGTSTFAEVGGELRFDEPTLAASSTCTFSADITLPADFEAGDVHHRTSPMTGIFASSTFAVRGGEATLSVVEPLDWRGTALRAAHATQAAPIEVVITNSTASPATDLAFTLDLDAVATGLVAEGLPTADACGTGSSLTGTDLVTLTGGSLSAGQSCTLNFDVRVPADVVGATTLVLASSDLTATIDAVTESASPLGIALLVPQPCREGYEPDDDSCIDIDECTTSTDTCDPLASCANTVGGHDCTCASGYSGDGRTCTDIDECTDNLDDCGTDATCSNTAGAFTCACDTGFSGDGQTCAAICGDGLVLGDEACDDADTAPGDGCDADCAVEPGWVCVGEPSDCAETCGDGVLDDGEGCDDGNTDVDDGCDATCQVEPGWACAGEPSECEDTCGDGAVDATEGCDDGNAENDDGCDTSCQVEDGWVCEDGDCNQEGCGCAVSGPASLGWLALTPLALIRRQRR
ncbi:MAG: DUF4215 domain-containing protein [Proteobacteria bacterium]|nr:DUF4215 domain-containing protein [Pseudomonadota bacterium]